jgi:hypothetical protein
VQQYKLGKGYFSISSPNRILIEQHSSKRSNKFSSKIFSEPFLPLKSLVTLKKVQKIFSELLRMSKIEISGGEKRCGGKRNLLCTYDYVEQFFNRHKHKY